MININKEDNSVIYVHPQTGYFLNSNRALRYLLIEDQCGDCSKMSRLSMSCYAATKHSNGTVARIQTNDKPKGGKPLNKYAEMETTVSLDKYNGKLMNSIWGLYNRNSPHNFKQNADNIQASARQEMTTSETKFTSPLVYFTIPNFSGIVSVETKIEVKKPINTLESFEKHIENLFNLPIF